MQYIEPTDSPETRSQKGDYGTRESTGCFGCIGQNDSYWQICLHIDLTGHGLIEESVQDYASIKFYSVKRKEFGNDSKYVWGTLPCCGRNQCSNLILIRNVWLQPLSMRSTNLVRPSQWHRSRIYLGISYIPCRISMQGTPSSSTLANFQSVISLAWHHFSHQMKSIWQKELIASWNTT